MITSRGLKAGDTLTKGQIVMFTAGDYSDYHVKGIYEVLEDVVIPAKVYEKDHYRAYLNKFHYPDLDILSTDLRLKELEVEEIETGVY